MNRALIKQMYEAGLSLRQIEKQLGIPYSSAREALLDMGVELRTRSESLRMRFARKPKAPSKANEARAISGPSPIPTRVAGDDSALASYPIEA